MTCIRPSKGRVRRVTTSGCSWVMTQGQKASVKAKPKANVAPSLRTLPYPSWVGQRIVVITTTRKGARGLALAIEWTPKVLSTLSNFKRGTTARGYLCEDDLGKVTCVIKYHSYYLKDHDSWSPSWDCLGRVRFRHQNPRHYLTLHEQDHESWSSPWRVKVARDTWCGQLMRVS